jgi:hypothetical protein
VLALGAAVGVTSGLLSSALPLLAPGELRKRRRRRLGL